MHSRWRPARNRFAYSLLMACVDLSELDSGLLDGWPLFSSKTRYAIAAVLPDDHLSGHGTLRTHGALAKKVRNVACEQYPHIVTSDGPVRLLTGMRLFGLEFNPVSFYYLLDTDQHLVQAVVAEVNNIPWFQQHLYVLVPESVAPNDPDIALSASDAGENYLKTMSDSRPRFLSHEKAFHVSPFMPMDQIKYDWQVSFPGSTLSLRIDLADAHSSLFMASLKLHRRTFSLWRLLLLLFLYPLMSIKVVVGIMYEAAKLWKHGAFTFYPHPDGAETRVSKAIATVVSVVVSLQSRMATKSHR